MINFRDTLLACPLLETLELTGGLGTHRVHAGDEFGPVELPHLKSCTMISIDHEDQGFITSLIAFPKHCTLSIIPLRVPVRQDSPVLHPVVLDSLRPIQMTTVDLSDFSVLFAESQQDSRCTLRVALNSKDLKGSKIHPDWNTRLWHGFDLDSVTTLIVNSVAIINLEGEYMSHVLNQLLPRIRNLVIARDDLLDKLQAALSHRGFEISDSLSQLEALVFQGMDVSTSSGAGVGIANTQAVRTFVDRMPSTEALRLLLQDCKTDREGLNALRAILPVHTYMTCT